MNKKIVESVYLLNSHKVEIRCIADGYEQGSEITWKQRVVVFTNYGAGK